MEDATTLIPEYDELPLGMLQHRVRALDEDQLGTVIEYERQHANRAPVLQVLHARLDALQHGAEPSPGPQEHVPEAESGRTGSPVQPSTAAELHTPLRNAQSGQTTNRRGRG